MTMTTTADRVGLGWRADLAAGIFAHRDKIDVVEVIAEDFVDVSKREIRALKTLSSQIPVVLHGVGMGLASCSNVEQCLLDKMARLVEQVQPECWSEHLAFVRAGDVEIGHLAAPPRTRENVEGTVKNVLRAERTVGSKPALENIATLIDPPGSTMEELPWIIGILELSDCELLLDLHNVFVNGMNHAYDPRQFVQNLPANRMRMIHIAGGKVVAAPDGTTRIFDDHLHDVPDPVFDLLEETATISPNALTVILERDGEYPPMPELVAQIERARRALARGRARRAVGQEVSV